MPPDYFLKKLCKNVQVSNKKLELIFILNTLKKQYNTNTNEKSLNVLFKP